MGKASFLISLVLPDVDPRLDGLWCDQIDVFWRLRVRVEYCLRVGEKGCNLPESRISQGVGTAYICIMCVFTSCLLSFQHLPALGNIPHLHAPYFFFF